MRTNSFVSRLSLPPISCFAAILLAALAWSGLAFCGEIHDAAAAGDLARVKAFLKANPDLVFSKGNDGYTALHWAAYKGHKDVAELLLANGAEVDAKEDYGTTPLGWAAVRGHKDVVELLLANRADVNAKDNDGRTPLHMAAANGHNDVAELLRQHGGQDTTTTNTTIYHAAKGGDLARVKALLEGNSELVFSKDNDGWTPLHYAARYGHKDVVELLLAHGAEVNAKDNYGQTPLHMAAANDHKEVAELLLANRAEVNAKMNAPSSSSVQVVAPTRTGGTEVLRDGTVRQVTSGEAMADMNTMWERAAGGTPLHFAAERGYKDVVELLLANRADVNAKDNDGRTPLHRAAYSRKKDVAELLLANGAEVNAKDYYGQTPLRMVRSNKDMAMLLRQHGGHK